MRAGRNVSVLAGLNKKMRHLVGCGKTGVRVLSSAPRLQ